MPAASDAGAATAVIPVLVVMSCFKLVLCFFMVTGGDMAFIFCLRRAQEIEKQVRFVLDEQRPKSSAQ